jgi:hypothetical protein
VDGAHSQGWAQVLLQHAHQGLLLGEAARADDAAGGALRRARGLAGVDMLGGPSRTGCTAPECSGGPWLPGGPARLARRGAAGQPPAELCPGRPPALPPSRLHPSHLRPSRLQERADQQTAWKEFTAPDGRKYFYNRVTKVSSWTVPEELSRAREAAGGGPQAEGPGGACKAALAPPAAAGAAPLVWGAARALARLWHGSAG